MRRLDAEIAGVTEVQRALADLVRLGRRAAEAYRAAEEVVDDHRVQAALIQLRLDHERHADELEEALGELGGEAPNAQGEAEEDENAVEAVVRRGATGGVEVFSAMLASEDSLMRAYERYVGRGFTEPVRAMLARHHREEEAHLEWLEESHWWRAMRAGE